MHSSHLVRKAKNDDYRVKPEIKEILEDQPKYKKLCKKALNNNENISLRECFKDKKGKNKFLLFNSKEEHEGKLKSNKRNNLRQQILEHNRNLEIEVHELKEKAIKEYGVKFESVKNEEKVSEMESIANSQPKPKWIEDEIIESEEASHNHKRY